MSLLSTIAPIHFGPLVLLDAPLQPPLEWWQWLAMLLVKVGILIGGGFVVKSFLGRLIQTMAVKPPGADSAGHRFGNG